MKKIGSLLPPLSAVCFILTACDKPAPVVAPTPPATEVKSSTEKAPTVAPAAEGKAAEPAVPPAPPQPAQPPLAMDSPEVTGVLEEFTSIGKEMAEAVASGERTNVIAVSRKGRELMSRSGQIQLRIPSGDLKTWEEKLAAAKQPYLEAARQWAQQNSKSTLQSLEGLRDRVRQARENRDAATENPAPAENGAPAEQTPGGPPKAVDTPPTTPAAPAPNGAP